MRIGLLVYGLGFTSTQQRIQLNTFRELQKKLGLTFEALQKLLEELGYMTD